MTVLTIKAKPLTDEAIDAMRATLNRPRLRPGECPHPQCTGVHSHSKPREEWCPRTIDLDRDWDSNVSRMVYKTLWDSRRSIVDGGDRLAALGFGRDEDPLAGLGPLPSGARDARTRRIIEALRVRRQETVAWEAT